MYSSLIYSTDRYHRYLGPRVSPVQICAVIPPLCPDLYHPVACPTILCRCSLEHFGSHIQAHRPTTSHALVRQSPCNADHLEPAEPVVVLAANPSNQGDGEACRHRPEKSRPANTTSRTPSRILSRTCDCSHRLSRCVWRIACSGTS